MFQCPNQHPASFIPFNSVSPESPLTEPIDANSMHVTLHPGRNRLVQIDCQRLIEGSTEPPYRSIARIWWVRFAHINTKTEAGRITGCVSLVCYTLIQAEARNGGLGERGVWNLSVVDSVSVDEVVGDLVIDGCESVRRKEYGVCEADGRRTCWYCGIRCIRLCRCG